MKVLHLSPITSAMSFAIALAAPTASDAAEIKVLTSRAMNHVLTELASGFQRTSERWDRRHKVILILAPPYEIKRRIFNGEIVDVTMTANAIVTELVQQGKIASDTKVSLALVGIGVAVRTGSARPDITSVAQFSHYRLSIPARNQQVEQNRASPLFVHQYQLAG
jgi:molybdate transport system substrate-binding protein